MHICKGWKLTHCKFTTWLFTLIQKGVRLCMLSSYLSCNIHVFLKFYVGNKYILEQYLQEFRWVNHHSGGVEWEGDLEPRLPWEVGDYTPLFQYIKNCYLELFSKYSSFLELLASLLSEALLHRAKALEVWWIKYLYL